MNKAYIDARNKHAIAHFQKLGCTLIEGVHHGQWRTHLEDDFGFPIYWPVECRCYYVYGADFDKMSKTAFHKYMKRHSLLLEQQTL